MACVARAAVRRNSPGARAACSYLAGQRDWTRVLLSSVAGIAASTSDSIFNGLDGRSRRGRSRGALNKSSPPPLMELEKGYVSNGKAARERKTAIDVKAQGNEDAVIGPARERKRQRSREKKVLSASRLTFKREI
ncbi:hypothetical protein Cni_G16635 [Canna indica]|uniref:Uncharacterized protein n=1 Tax=Canna indica TaxID=4628 RepID=A0AAQ3KFL3_9LILI|nr:hypothetical protein Cni_G16635 [Canna indica]